MPAIISWVVSGHSFIVGLPNRGGLAVCASQRVGFSLVLSREEVDDVSLCYLDLQGHKRTPLKSNPTFQSIS
jgi:hypothetical protein